MNREIIIEGQYFGLADFKHLLKDRPNVSISPVIREGVRTSRQALHKILAESDVPIYGINTGFGKLSTVRISDDEHLELQVNLIRSHAAGTGEPLSADIVRLALFLKIISLCHGYSGVREVVVDQLTALLNADALPVIPSQGSVGASGDLAPLAHMSLPLIGEGEVDFDGARMSGKDALAKLDLEPIVLHSKEGLALINGTQIGTALGLESMLRLDNLTKVADIVGAMTVDGLKGTPAPFMPNVHKLKHHPGQRDVAQNLISVMDGSTIRESHRDDDDQVQDMYSVRCMPQVHGACRDTVNHATTQILNEANSVSDNPLVFPDTGEFISAGHFHGEASALANDIAALAVAELGNISERRIFALLLGLRGLPPFLTPKPGLNSGFMMGQVTAAALASENKTLAHPASADTIPTGSDQEDHVSMAPWAGRKLGMMVANLESILAIEFLTAAQAIDFRTGLKPGNGAVTAVSLLRKYSSKIEEDRALAPEIEHARSLIRSGAVVLAVEKVVSLK